MSGQLNLWSRQKLARVQYKAAKHCNGIEIYVVEIMRGSQLDFVSIFPKYVATQFEERSEEHCRDIPFFVVKIMEKRP